MQPRSSLTVPGLGFSISRLSSVPLLANPEAPGAWAKQVFDGVDALTFPTAAGHEELLLFHRPGTAVYEPAMAAGSSLRLASPGRAEVVDRAGHVTLTVTAPLAWDGAGRELVPRLRVEGRRVLVEPPHGATYPVLVDPLWSPAPPFDIARVGHTATLLSDGRVLVAGGRTDIAEGAGAELATLYASLEHTSRLGATMVHPRHSHAAVLTTNGRVVLFGGQEASMAPGVSQEGWPPSPPPEVFDPRALSGDAQEPGAFSELGPAPSFAFVPGPAVALSANRALVLGGDPGQARARVATTIYQVDLDTGETAPVATLSTPRRCAGAALLPDGRVLIAGGEDEGGALVPRAEIYQEGSGSTSPAGEMVNGGLSGCTGHPGPLDTALFADGAVFFSSPDVTRQIEVYSPASSGFVEVFASDGAFDATGGPPPLLLGSGAMLTWNIGLQNVPNYIHGTPTRWHLNQDKTRYVYEAATVSVGYQDPALTPGERQTLTALPSGEALLLGGPHSGVGQVFLGHSDFPVRDASERMLSLLLEHDLLAAKAPGGKVVVGTSNSGIYTYDAEAGLLKSASPLGFAQDDRLASTASGHTVARRWQFLSLFDGDGELVAMSDPVFPVIGGEHWFERSDGYVVCRHRAKEATFTCARVNPTFDGFSFDEAPVPPAITGRVGSTMLPAGPHSLLLVGGGKFVGEFDPPVEDLLASSTVEVADLKSGKSTLLPFFLQTPRSANHQLIRLNDGRILIAGGRQPNKAYMKEAEILDIEGGSSTPIPGGTKAFWSGRALALLASGDVLSCGPTLPSAEPTPFSFELFDAQKSAFAEITTEGEPLLYTASSFIELPQCAILPDDAGGALVLGNVGPRLSGQFAYALHYDPTTRSVAPHPETGGPLLEGTAAARLPDGGMLLLGASAQRFDPFTGHRKALAFAGKTRRFATATLLSTGKVLVAGGQELSSGEALADAWLFDPATDGFSALEGLREARSRHSATVLPGGAVLIAGGEGANGKLASRELFDTATLAARAAAPMLAARSGHVAMLLPSGEVLFAGGLASLGGLSAELFEPTGGGASALDAPVLWGDTCATPLPGGDVLLARKNQFFTFDARTRSFLPTTLTSTNVDAGGLSSQTLPPPEGADVLVPSLTGSVFGCSAARCGQISPRLGAFNTELDFTRTQLEPPRLAVGARTPRGGSLLVFEPVAHDPRPQVYMHTPVPAGAPRPSIAAPAGPLVTGESVTLAGHRLTRLAVRGAEALGARPEAHPLLVWLPESGASLFGSVTAWTDESVTFSLPSTAYTGPGFLHVIVGGVASDGVFAELRALARGAPCEHHHECSTGACVDGVCCESTCGSPCHACSRAARGHAPGEGPADGTCAALAANQPDTACPPQQCVRTGLCDVSGSCQPVIEASLCSLDEGLTGVCRSGACQPEDRCTDDGKGVTKGDGTTRVCVPYVCRQGACLQQCSGPDDCAGEGYECANGACVQVCVDEQHGPAGESCGAYRCREGRCLTVCDTRADCGEKADCLAGECIATCVDDVHDAEGHACGAYRCLRGQCLGACESNVACSPGAVCEDGLCRPRPQGQAYPDTGACSSARGTGGAWWAALLAALAARRGPRPSRPRPASSR